MVMAAEHHQLAAGATQLDDKAVVLFAGVAGRRASVEDIAGDQHGIDRQLTYLFDQPGAERLMLGLAGLAHKVLAKVPVGGVQNAHAQNTQSLTTIWVFTFCIPGKFSISPRISLRRCMDGASMDTSISVSPLMPLQRRTSGNTRISST